MAFVVCRHGVPFQQSVTNEVAHVLIQAAWRLSIGRISQVALEDDAEDTCCDQHTALGISQPVRPFSAPDGLAFMRAG